MALVLLPGMMCDQSVFEHQIAHFSSMQTIVVPNYGEAETINGMALSVLEQAPSRFALLGFSMGGIVAMEVFRIAPQRITRLALLDTNPKAELKSTQLQRDVQIKTVLSGGLAQVMTEEMFPLYFAENTEVKHLSNKCLAMAMALGSEAFIRQSRALQQRADQTEALRMVQVPTLIMMGAEDRLCPLDRHELLAELIPQSQLVIVPNAGHMITLEQPDFVNEALDKWLN